MTEIKIDLETREQSINKKMQTIEEKEMKMQMLTNQNKSQEADYQSQIGAIEQKLQENRSLERQLAKVKYFVYFFMRA